VLAGEEGFAATRLGALAQGQPDATRARYASAVAQRDRRLQALAGIKAPSARHPRLIVVAGFGR
jgi:hypothetical protein